VRARDASVAGLGLYLASTRRHASPTIMSIVAACEDRASMAIFSTGHSPAGRCEPRALVTYIDLTSVNIVLISPERKAHVEVA